MAMGQGSLDLEALTGSDMYLAGQGLPDQADGFARQVRQVGQRLVLDLAGLPVGAAQEGGLVDLVLVVTTSGDHVHGAALPDHRNIVPRRQVDGKNFSDYTM